MDEPIELDNDELEEQAKNSPADRIRPWQYKKGQSGNPGGRPKGISLKEWAKNKLATMTDEEKEDFLNGVNKNVVWEMAEGKASSNDKLEVEGNITINKISFDDYDTPQPETK